MFEQDDLELWTSATQASDNPIARRFPYSFHSSLPFDDAPVNDAKGPGRAYKPANTEVAQFAFMQRWDAALRPESLSMDDMTPVAHGNAWVDAADGTVSREIFVSDDVFRWSSTGSFTGSGSSSPTRPKSPTEAITSPGPWDASPFWSSAATTARFAFCSISCRHRGTKLCRGETGNARYFVCPITAGATGRTAELISTSYDEHLPADVDKADWGLVPAPKVESYKGLVFAAWDPGAPELRDYLGDIAWYLDALFWRTPGGMEVLGPPHRWRARANWKIGSLNFIGDGQHVATTHAGPSTLNRLHSKEAGFSCAAATASRSSPTRGTACTLTYLAPACPSGTISPTRRRCATPTRRS